MSAEMPRDVPSADAEHLVLALVSVDGTMAACADHGDAATLRVLSGYYALVANTITSAGGRIVKVMGDGVLAAFPCALAAEAVVACQQLQATATAHWQTFDVRCRARVVLGAGPVLRGRFGPPGQERDDLFGHSLNQLFRAPAGGVVLLPSLEALLQ